MSLKINNLIESLKEKYGELEVDGEYGEQFVFLNLDEFGKVANECWMM